MNVYRQDCSKFDKSDKVALRCAALDLYYTMHACMMNSRAPDGANKFGWLGSLISNQQVPLEGRHPVLYIITQISEKYTMPYSAMQYHPFNTTQYHAIPMQYHPMDGIHPLYCLISLKNSLTLWTFVMCWILLQHITILYWSHEAFFGKILKSLVFLSTLYVF